MYHMNSNVFSIAPNVVVSEKNFTRLNDWLRNNNFIVEETGRIIIDEDSFKALQNGLQKMATDT